MVFDDSFRSWGRVHAFNQEIVAPAWSQGAGQMLRESVDMVLPFGQGLTGFCLNQNGKLICTKFMDRVVEFDTEKEFANWLWGHASTNQ